MPLMLLSVNSIDYILLYISYCVKFCEQAKRNGIAVPLRLTDISVTFIVSVMAGVTSNYICKWLDRHSSDK